VCLLTGPVCRLTGFATCLARRVGTLTARDDTVAAMIGRLTGRVVAQDADGLLVLDVAGVGYEVTTPLGTLGRTHADDAGRVTLWVHTHVREEALALYGFSDDGERAAFRVLLGVSNVGPKIAVAVLGALPAPELSRAIARQDLGAMKGIPGVGKRIAERLLLELRDKLPEAPAAASGAVERRDAGTGSGGDERVRAALVGMGFKQVEADRAVAALGERDPATPLGTLLKDALAHLSH
jgi:holliday junction DNA helicase RuvA